jgi:hypothetical protein
MCRFTVTQIETERHGDVKANNHTWRSVHVKSPSLPESYWQATTIVALSTN